MTLLLIALGCTGNSDDTDEAPGISAQDVIGWVHKGPMTAGGEVTLTPAEGDPVSASTDELGRFEASVMSSGPVAVRARGLWFNEVTGEASSEALTLRAWVDLDAEESLGVNPVTELTYDRMAVLIDAGDGFAEAQMVAEAELRLALGVGPDSVQDLTASGSSLSLLGDDEGGSWLFGVCVVLAEAAERRGGGGEMAGLLTELADDFQEDGTLGVALLEEIEHAEAFVDAANAEGNLTSYLAGHGHSGPLAPLAEGLDRDGDGVSNAVDDQCDHCGIPQSGDAAAFAALVLQGPTDAALGYAIAFVGDTAGDGGADLVLGAPGAESGRGGGWLVTQPSLGTVEMSAAPLFLGEPGDYAGTSVAGGDRDGDGVPELVFGSIGLEGDRGGAYVLIGAGGGELSAHPRLLGEVGSGAGRRVAVADRLATDGGEIVVTAPSASGAAADGVGAVYVISPIESGDQVLAEDAALRLEGYYGGGGLGGAILIDDLTGDGRDDLLIGGPGVWGGGKAYLVEGGGLTGVLDIGDAALGYATTTFDGAALGTSLASGDLLGTGSSMVAIGAPGRNRVYVLSPDASISEVAMADGVELAANGDSEHFGATLSVGDLDADGIDDLTISDALETVYVVYGPLSFGDYSLDVDSASVLTGEDDLGRAIASDGDLDGDGTSDLVIGTSAGLLYLFYGESLTP